MPSASLDVVSRAALATPGRSRWQCTLARVCVVMLVHA